MDELVTALGGPSGIGKSSTVKLVAQKLRLTYLDTEAMYRAVACEFARRGSNRTDETGIGELTRTADSWTTTDPDVPHVCINGRDVIEETRRPEIFAVVSVMAIIPGVCRVLTKCMHRVIVRHDRHMAMERRDVTTVVTPDTEVWVLLTADAVARIRRRTAELEEQVDQVAMMDSILRRSHDDLTVSNFTETADGVSVINSTHPSLNEVVVEILKLVPDA